MNTSLYSIYSVTAYAYVHIYVYLSFNEQYSFIASSEFDFQKMMFTGEKSFKNAHDNTNLIQLNVS